MSEPNTAAPNVNIPNALTTLRLFMVPVFGWLLLAQNGQSEGYRLAAAGVFVLASFTDYVDGALARKYNQVTSFGKIADPIADKALTGVALIGLSIIGDLVWWVTVVIIAREVMVTVIRFIVIRDGVIPASRGGKAKTISQMLAIFLYLLPWGGVLVPIQIGVMAIAVVLTLLSGFDYLMKAIKVHRGAQLRREAFGTAELP